MRRVSRASITPCFRSQGGAFQKRAHGYQYRPRYIACQVALTFNLHVFGISLQGASHLTQVSLWTSRQTDSASLLELEDSLAEVLSAEELEEGLGSVVDTVGDVQQGLEAAVGDPL